MRAHLSEALVGRDRELTILDALLTDLAAGRGRAVLVEGEPGIGKSALLAAGLAAAREAGYAVSHGTCDALGQRFPLSVLLEALAVDQRSPDRLSQAALTGDPVTVASEQLLALVDRLCAAGPLVLAVDDLQWADEASLLVWQRLCRMTARSPLLLVGTCRPVPRSAELVQLRGEVQRHHGVLISPSHLTTDEVAELARRLSGGAPGPLLAEVLTLAAGNPLYVREILDKLARAQGLAVVDHVAEIVSADSQRSQPLSLSGAIADRLDFLSLETRDLLRAAAMLEPEFSVTELSRILRRPACAFIGLLEEAISAGVLVSAGLHMSFRHGLLRQALYEAIPEPLRITLYKDAAQALMGGGAPVERVAALILGAGVAADGWELDWLGANADALSHRAPTIAAELLEHALAHTGEDDPRFATLQDRLASVFFLLARYEEAKRVARAILTTATADRRGLAVWILGYCLMRTAQADEALSIVREAATDPATDPLWQGRLSAMRAMITLTRGHFAEAATAADEALALGEGLSDPMTIGYALHTASMVRYAEQDMAGCVEYIARGLGAIGSDPELTDLRLLLQSNEISALCNLDRFEDAVETLRTARLLAERTGSTRLHSFVLLAGEVAHQMGRWDEALTDLDALWDPVNQAYAARILVTAHGIAALIAAHRDNRRAAARHFKAFDRIGDVRYKTNNMGYLLAARATSAERADRIDEAITTLKALLTAEYEVLDDRTSLFPTLIRLTVAAGDLSTAREAAAIAAAEARDNPLPRALAARDWCHGLLHRDPAPVLSAADYYRAGGRRLELGNALEDAATLLAERGDPAEARSALCDAVSIYTDLGAEWDSRRAAARLRDHGVRLGVRGARRRPLIGWEALTETELKIAELVAQGRSNPDIAADLVLSRRTVETHVSHIFAKLRAGSRREVAELVESRAGEVLGVR